VYVPQASLAWLKDGFGVNMNGGSIANLKAGTDIRINPAGTAITLTKGNEDLISIPAASITEISTDRMSTDVLCRNWLLLSRSE